MEAPTTPSREDDPEKRSTVLGKDAEGRVNEDLAEGTTVDEVGSSEEVEGIDEEEGEDDDGDEVDDDEDLDEDEDDTVAVVNGNTPPPCTYAQAVFHEHVLSAQKLRRRRSSRRRHYSQRHRQRRRRGGEEEDTDEDEEEEEVSDVCAACGVDIGPDTWFMSCEVCSISFCVPCVFESPGLRTMDQSIHPHELFSCSSPSEWTCSVCQASSTNSSATGCGMDRFLCAICSFDICFDCLERKSKHSVRTSVHPHHRLMPFYDDGGWSCAARGLPSGCSRLRRSANGTSLRYRCHRCDFDLCAADANALCIDPAQASFPSLTPDLLADPRHAGEEDYDDTEYTGPDSNEALVEMMKERGDLKTPAVIAAFAAVDRKIFVPELDPEPYSGEQVVTEAPAVLLKSVAYSAACLEALAVDLKPSMAFLVVPVGNGYMNCLSSVLVKKGLSLGISLYLKNVEAAESCISKFVEANPVGGFGNIQLAIGSVFALDPKESQFDRIHVEAICEGSAMKHISALLRVGGRMTAVVNGRVRVFLQTPDGLEDKGVIFNNIAAASSLEESLKKEPIVFRAPIKTSSSDGKMVSPSPSPTHSLGRRGSSATDQQEERSSSMASILTGSLEKYLKAFEDEEITLRSAPFLTDEDLRALGLPLGPRRAVIAEISRQTAGQMMKPCPQDSLENFLQAIGLRKYLSNLQKEEVTMDNIGLITESDLASMNIKLGPRRLIMAEVGRCGLHKSKSPMLSPLSSPPIVPEPMNVEFLPVTTVCVIGEGAFGRVWKGIWNKTTKVAIKTPHDGISSESILNEVSSFKHLKHPNVLQYYGIARLNGVLCVVMELANGSVLQLLRTRPDLKDGPLLDMAMSCAAGMHYLQEMRVIHRDLAARNLLWCNEGETYIVKVADFGLAKVITNSLYVGSSATPCAAKWSAIEVLQKRLFTHASDVWSFGIVLWELWSHGEEPYQLIDSTDVLKYLERGSRLTRPETCPDIIWDLMSQCWRPDTQDRPSFAEIFQELAKLSGHTSSSGTVKADFPSVLSVSY